MKRYPWIVAILLLLVSGCGKDRLADIATPEEIAKKDLLIIFPSIPEEFCYADRMATILDDIAADIGGADPQVLSVPESVDCSNYGFVDCTMVDLGTGENNKHSAAVECISEDAEHFCFYLLGNEYRDNDGNTFDDTCIQGMDSAVDKEEQKGK